MTLSELTELASGAVDDLKGRDTRLLDVAGLTTVTDHMLITTGTSVTHVKAIARRVIEDAKAAGRQPNGVEGLDGGEWVLVDLGDVVVHVMQAQTRAFYQLEKLWETGAGSADAEAAAAT